MARRTRPTALVFVDSTIDQHAHFAYEIAQFSQAELVLLDSQVDGIEQITTRLIDRQNLQSLHLVMKSDYGNFKLGTTQLTLFNLDRYGWQLQQWGDSFASQGRIFLHQWNQAQEFEGSNLFLARLSLLTGAKVAFTEHAAAVQEKPSSQLRLLN